MKKLSKFEKIFIKIVEVYVKKYPENSFSLIFDDFKYQIIGKSKNIINVRFNNSTKVFQKIFTEGSLGLGESYCEGNIEVKDSDYKYFLMIFVRIASDKKLLFKLSFTDIFYILKARFKNPFFKRKNQYENINSHYSLGDWFKNEEDSNEFYLNWLNSKYIQYSCAKWDKGVKTLEEAQKNKFEFYIKRLGIDKNSENKTLLDLGCGWGGFMFYVAEKYKIKCRGITLSKAQIKYINQEIKKRKLQDYIDVKHKNAHNIKGKYDYVISIGLLEHIDYYNDLYRKVAKSLKLNGKALFHAIFNTQYFYQPDSFLTKYIFPGGGTPNINKNLKIFRKYFNQVNRNDLPDISYPKTLEVWFENFCKNENNIRKLLKEKSSCEDIYYSIKIFKHYLILSYCGLSNSGVASNILVYNE